VIVLLDTTVFSADTLCAKAAWKALALAAPGWGIRVAVTEVVVAEAVANYQRRIETLRSELKVWVEKKNAEDHGLIRAFEAAQIVLSAESAEYAGHLNENIKASSVEILPVAQIPHMELVARATARRRPCDDHGNGYRDTLNLVDRT
jgi:predicted nucleic acid-binding protein